MNDQLKVTRGNLFSNLPHKRDQEHFDTIISAASIKVERIVSRGHRSAKDYWYDQPKNEWVMVLKGAAVLRFENDEKVLKLIPGDYVHIPAHCRHRMEWTDPEVETIWLAVHY